MDVLFINRADAGKQLAEALQQYKKQKNVLILALPRGGVPVAYPISVALDAPLDIFLVRKLGMLGQPELAMGAIASGGIIVLNTDVVDSYHISDMEIGAVIQREQAVIEEREQKYLLNRKPISIQGKTVIIVDDGIATGSTMLAAVRAIKQAKCEKIIIAVPVAPRDSIRKLQKEVDEIVCLYQPSLFFSIGNFYQDFTQTMDAEVIDLLKCERKKHFNG